MHSFRHQEFPDYTLQEFHPRRSRYCFMPVIYNEGSKFLRQMERMSANSGLADIIVTARESNDGCTDPEFLRKHGAQSLLQTKTPGAASSIRVGF